MIQSKVVTFDGHTEGSALSQTWEMHQQNLDWYDKNKMSINSALDKFKGGYVSESLREKINYSSQRRFWNSQEMTISAVTADDE